MRRYARSPLTPPQIKLGQIPTGYRGTTSTIGHIQALIRAGAKDFYVRQRAIDILLARQVRPKDYLGEIKALFEWVQRNVRYTKDPYRVEVLHTARRMLELRAGDCDDMAILLGAMLEAIGHPVRLVVTGPDPLRPRLFTHVYLEVYLKGRWVPLDATMPFPPNWAPQTFVRQVFALERRPEVQPGPIELQGIDAVPGAPDWLATLIRAMRGESLAPKDARVKSLWNMLNERRLLRQSPWMQRVLRHAWSRGLQARQRPKLARRLVRRLRRWGILPARAVARPVALRPLRPVALRPVRSMAVRPIQRAGARPGVAGAARP
jgi:hypothetical protein